MWSSRLHAYIKQLWKRFAVPSLIMDYQVPLYTSATTPVRQRTHKSKSQSKPKPKVKAGKQHPETTVRYLASVHHPAAFKAAVQHASDPVVKSICNAALNVSRGDGVRLSQNQKKLFRTHAADIAALASKGVALKRKRGILQQKGGAFWIPALIGAALGGLGSSLFGGHK